MVCNGRNVVLPKMTVSPRRNILLMNRSLLTGFAFFPLPLLGTSVHISLTFSSTMLQCRSKALTRANSLRLLRQLISTCELFFTACCNTDSGPVLNSCSSISRSSASDISDFGFAVLQWERSVRVWGGAWTVIGGEMEMAAVDSARRKTARSRLGNHTSFYMYMLKVL